MSLGNAVKMSGAWVWFLVFLLLCYGLWVKDFASGIVPALRAADTEPQFPELQSDGIGDRIRINPCKRSGE